MQKKMKPRHLQSAAWSGRAAARYGMQKHRTSRNCMTNFLRIENGICNAGLDQEEDLYMHHGCNYYEYDTFAQDTRLVLAKTSRRPLSFRRFGAGITRWTSTPR